MYGIVMHLIIRFIRILIEVRKDCYVLIFLIEIVHKRIILVDLWKKLNRVVKALRNQRYFKHYTR